MLPLKISMQIEEALFNMGWDETDDIVVEVGGTVVSGIHQPPEANERWSLAFGERKYNKDAFLVISNNSRRDNTKSQPKPND